MPDESDDAADDTVRVDLWLADPDDAVREAVREAIADQYRDVHLDDAAIVGFGSGFPGIEVQVDVDRPTAALLRDVAEADLPRHAHPGPNGDADTDADTAGDA
jgi:hypothetical protein